MAKASEWYEIEIINWEKYQYTKDTKRHTWFRLENDFLSDPKIMELKPFEIVLLLSLFQVASKVKSKSVRVSLRSLQGGSKMKPTWIRVGINHLEQLQIVKVISQTTTNNTEQTERTLHTDRASEIKIPRKRISRAALPTAPDGTNEVIKFYCDEWRKRYQVSTSPPIQGQDASKMKNLVKTIGKDRSIILVTAFLKMADSWFITKRHDIPTLVNNLNAVSQYAENARMITKHEARSMEATSTNTSTLAALRNGELT